MHRKKKVEETSRTADLRNVIAEIQKVDQETADLKNVVEEVKKVEKKEKTEKRGAVVTCRVLFYSVYHKIFLFLLFFGFVGTTIFNFKGNIFSSTYGYWIRVLIEVGIIIGFILLSFLFNWFYHCIVKTMLCITRGGIYKETYFPFGKKETTIPFRHVTSVSALTILWIFRAVVIFQYRHMPLVFFTWNHEKFKRKIDEILGQDTSVSNSYENKSLFQERYIPFLQWMFIILGMILFLLGIVHLFGYISSHEASMSGKYQNGSQYILLKSNQTCDVKVNRIHDLLHCTWAYDEDDQTIVIQYEYSKDNYFGTSYNKKDKMVVGYKEKTLTYNGVEYTK
ncbi:MAG: hypothetical protein J6X28_02110 [Bacilli bacterium]|nr:hypothetical protein [Bacilli bacterium]